MLANNRSWPWIIPTFAVLFSLGLNACQQTKRKNSEVKFDWDTDLGPLETKTGVPKAEDLNRIDDKFCKGLKPGACFSLIIRVPKADLVQDIGLSTLALAGSSKNMRLRLDEACQAAWTDYRQKYLFDNLHPLRSRFVRGIEKMRCIYLFMSEEYVQEETALASNEIAFSTRLSKFEIGGEEASLDVGLLGLQVKKTFVQTSFRTQYIYHGKDLGASNAGWQAALGFGPEVIDVRTKVERDINWKIDVEALKKNLEKVAADTPAAQAAAATFFGQARSAVGTVAAASNPAHASLLMVGMGYNAFRAVCGENQEYCKASLNKSSATPGVSEDLADLVPSSETNELYRLAVIRSVQGMLDKLLIGTDNQQLKQKFGIK